MMAGEYGTAVRQERALYPSHLFSLLLADLGQVSSPRFPFVKQELWYICHPLFVHSRNEQHSHGPLQFPAWCLEARQVQPMCVVLKLS